MYVHSLGLVLQITKSPLTQSALSLSPRVALEASHNLSETLSSLVEWWGDSHQAHAVSPNMKLDNPCL